MHTVIDRVTTPQPGDSKPRQGSKLALMILLGATPIGWMVALYFLFGGWGSWMNARSEVGYVPFRVRWNLLACLVAGFTLFGYLVGLSQTAELQAEGAIWWNICGAMLFGVLVWAALTALRFAFHLVDCRLRKPQVPPVALVTSPPQTPPDQASVEPWELAPRETLPVKTTVRYTQH